MFRLFNLTTIRNLVVAALANQNETPESAVNQPKYQPRIFIGNNGKKRTSRAKRKFHRQKR